MKEIHGRIPMEIEAEYIQRNFNKFYRAMYYIRRDGIKGNRLENDEGIWAWNEIPNSKQSKIEKRNKGKDYASKIEPKTTQLQENEKGKKE